MGVSTDENAVVKHQVAAGYAGFGETHVAITHCELWSGCYDAGAGSLDGDGPSAGTTHRECEAKKVFEHGIPPEPAGVKGRFTRGCGSYGHHASLGGSTPLVVRLFHSQRGTILRICHAIWSTLSQMDILDHRGIVFTDPIGALADCLSGLPNPMERRRLRHPDLQASQGGIRQPAVSEGWLGAQGDRSPILNHRSPIFHRSL